MQHREAAVRLTQTVQTITRELIESVTYLYAYRKKDEISEKEFNDYLEKTQQFVENTLGEFAEPLYEHHPDLREHCCSCDIQQESQYD